MKTNATAAITPITASQSPKPHRLAVLPTRRGCTSADVRLLVRLHNRLERVTRTYIAVTDAILRRLGAV